jgi:DNA-binding GntR family transcriptional regulator
VAGLLFVDNFSACIANEFNDEALPEGAHREGTLDDQPADKADARAAARSSGAPAVSPAATEGTPPICSLTLPQQIADHLGHRIMNGDYAPGARLKEEELAESYAVSRGPVREAFRLLERRGFVEIVPRHGARVREFDPADLASLFSVRAVLLGLAARQATEQANPQLLPLLAEPVARLRQSAERMDIAPREHARIAGEAQHLIARFSGNKPLLRTIEELTSRALWRMAWRDTPLDFTTRARRQASAKYWGDLVRAIKAGDAARAEHVARRLQEASRDHMIAAMAAHRAMSVAAD